MKICLDDFKGLAQPRVNLSFKENLSDIDAVKPVVGELTVTAGSTGMRLTGSVQTLLKLSCDRCLQPYFQSMNVEIDELFVSHSLADDRSGQDSRERELTQGDFFETLPPDGILDIDDVVYQAVTLARPTSCLCSEECPGPPLPDSEHIKVSLAGDQKSPKNRDSIDPRWKNLKSLFPNEDS